MLHHLTAPVSGGEKFGNALHVVLAAVFGLMSLHMVFHILTHMA